MEWYILLLLPMIYRNTLKNIEYLSKRIIVNCNFVANGFCQLEFNKKRI